VLIRPALAEPGEAENPKPNGPVNEIGTAWKKQAGNVDPAEVAWKQAAAVWGAKGRFDMPA
jgi:hypothetical protein